MPKGLVDKLQVARAESGMVGERRVITILFCDVKGSTAAAEQLDPEEWAEIMTGAFEYMIRPVYRYEGTVARLMGDAILAFFGAPIAHEDDPQRAVLAGLDIVEGIDEYREQVRRQWGIDFGVRVGVNTGLVVAGAIGSDLRMEYTAMGDAVNLAARMEQTAEPGAVQIAEETYKRVGGLFEFDELGGVQVKGKSEPVQAYRVLGRAGTLGRPRGIEGLDAPLIGRARERAALEEAIANLKTGTGAIVFLVGEAGLGKSRLIQEIRVPGSWARSEIAPSATWFDTASLSYETDQAYALFRQLMRSIFGAQIDEGTEALRDRLRSAVAVLPADERGHAERVFAALLDLAGDGEPPLEGETFRVLLYRLMVSWWEQRAKRGPVVIVCDDLHWSDPASLALLEHIYPLTEDVPLLLLCALRPEQNTPAWQTMQAAARDFPHRYREVRLQPLSASESGQLLQGLLRKADLPAALHHRIMEKSEGNPYFVEEVVRTLIEQEILVRQSDGETWQAASDGAEWDIPANLQTLLVARIDRLAELARRTLQAAAVIGRSFHERVLQQIVDAATELDAQLLTLEQRQFILETARLPEREYIFRHALTQEAAYSTVLLRERRLLHRAVGESLERLFPEQREELAGALARHFFKARDFTKALDFYTVAGDRAYRLHAAREAADHYEKALQSADKVEAGGERLAHVYTRLGRAYELDGRFQEAKEKYLKMLRLSQERNDRRLELAALVPLCILHATQTPLYDPSQARVMAEQAINLAQRLGDQAAQARVLWAMLVVEAWSVDGDRHKALEYGLRSLEISRALGLKEQMGFTLTNLVNAYWNLDQLEAGRQANLEALAIWKELENLPMLADAYTMRQSTLLDAFEMDAAMKVAQEGLRISRSIGNLWNQMTSLYYLTQIYMLRGNISLALETKAKLVRVSEEAGFFQHLERRLQLVLALAVGQLEEAGAVAASFYEQRDIWHPLFRPEWFAHVARAKIARGEFEQAAKILDEAFGELDLDEAPVLYTDHLFLAEIQLLLAQGASEQALRRTNYVADRLREVGYHLLLPEALWLQGKAYLALEQLDRAEQALAEALAHSRKSGECLLRWRILDSLTEVEAHRRDAAAAEKYREQARGVINNIASRMPPDWRAAFLAWPEVRRVTDP